MHLTNLQSKKGPQKVNVGLHDASCISTQVPVLSRFVSCFVRNVGHFHNCTYSHLSDRLYRITTVKPGNYCLARARPRRPRRAGRPCRGESTWRRPWETAQRQPLIGRAGPARVLLLRQQPVRTYRHRAVRLDVLLRTCKTGCAWVVSERISSLSWLYYSRCSSAIAS